MSFQTLDNPLRRLFIRSSTLFNPQLHYRYFTSFQFCTEDMGMEFYKATATRDWKKFLQLSCSDGFRQECILEKLDFSCHRDIQDQYTYDLTGDDFLQVTPMSDIDCFLKFLFNLSQTQWSVQQSEMLISFYLQFFQPVAGFVDKGKVKIFMEGFLDVVESVNHLQKNTTGLTYDKPTLLIENSHCFLVTKYNHTKFLQKEELLNYIAWHYSMKKTILDEEIAPQAPKVDSLVGGKLFYALLLKLYPADDVLEYVQYIGKNWLYLYQMNQIYPQIAKHRFRKLGGRRHRVVYNTLNCEDLKVKYKDEISQFEKWRERRLQEVG